MVLNWIIHSRNRVIITDSRLVKGHNYPGKHDYFGTCENSYLWETNLGYRQCEWGFHVGILCGDFVREHGCRCCRKPFFSLFWQSIPCWVAGFWYTKLYLSTIYPSIYRSVYLSIDLSIYLSIYLFVCCTLRRGVHAQTHCWLCILYCFLQCFLLLDNAALGGGGGGQEQLFLRVMFSAFVHLHWFLQCFSRFRTLVFLHHLRFPLVFTVFSGFMTLLMLRCTLGWGGVGQSRSCELDKSRCWGFIMLLMLQGGC